MTTIYFQSHLPAKYKTEKWRCMFSQWYDANDPFLGKRSIHDLTPAAQEDYNKYINNQAFNTREEWMMVWKALIFAKGEYRETNLAIADQMVQSKSPKTCRSLGRKVKGYDDTIWDEWKVKVVENGNYLQFSQNQEMKKVLLDSGDREIVEAASYDSIWAVGFTESNAEANRNKWGLNLLGKSLMNVRNILRNE